jgi:hypothetical protein
MNKEVFEGGIRMENWKKLDIDGIVDIEKCVAEFNVWELRKTPWGKFKVKIFENANGNFTGYTNLMLRDETEDHTPYGGVGHGNDIAGALEDTVYYFMKMINERMEKGTLNEEDFEVAESYDF